MDFRLEYKPEHLEPSIKMTDKIFLIGSCFTEHMFERFDHFKFQALQNPHGTLFNPKSILDAINQYINITEIRSEDLFLQNTRWNHWNFHSSLSHHSKETAQEQMQQAVSNGYNFLKSANWLIITFGSAFVYDNGDQIVANCHKMPAQNFRKYMLGPEHIIEMYSIVLKQLLSFNPQLNILFTVSPVRHLKDGFIENNRSKAALLLAIEQLVKQHTHCHYFPSYELIIDDLRDYRFYAEDMVHPNYQATRYVWEKFSESSIEGKTKEVLKEIDHLKAAMKHKVMHPGSDEHMKFARKFYDIAIALQARFPNLDFEKEKLHFKVS